MTKKNLGTLCVQAGYEPKNGRTKSCANSSIHNI